MDRCIYIYRYLDGFIEPSIDGVPVATSSVDHLKESIGVDSTADLFFSARERRRKRLIDADDHAGRFDGLQGAGVD